MKFDLNTYNGDFDMKKMNVKHLVLMGLCIALSYIGAMIKIQQTIAFDALPAFFAAILLGPIAGGIVGLIGHLLTALLSGFPLSLPIHLVVGGMMFVSCASFGFVYKKSNKVVAVLVGVIMNGPISLAVAAIVFDLFITSGAGFGMFLGMILVLTIAAAANVILAVVIYELTKKYIKLD